MVEIGPIADLGVYEDQNPNVGTQRGVYLREKSLSRCRTGRSVVVDRNNRVICGEKTVLACYDAGLEEAVFFESHGERLLVHRRVDLDLTRDPIAWELALLDNMSGREAAMNPERVLFLRSRGVDVGVAFKADMLRRMEKKVAAKEQPASVEPSDSVEVVEASVDRTLKFQVEEGAALVIESQIDRICSRCGVDKGEALERMALLAAHASDEEIRGRRDAL